MMRLSAFSLSIAFHPQNTRRMLNYIWLGLILAAVLIGGVTGRLPAVTEGAFEMAKSAVTIALGLIGVMALWLGLMRLAERSGLVQIIAAGLRPVMKWLFPEVPPAHPAMGSMLMNIAANMLGLANAATPLGLRAMKDLERLNPHPGTATNAMCTFLAINTSSVQLIPATAVAILASAGSRNPSAIIGTAFAATLCSTAAGIAAVKLLEKLPAYHAPASATRDTAAPTHDDEPETPLGTVELRPLNRPRVALLWIFILAFAVFALIALFPAQFGITATPVEGGPIVRIVSAISLIAVPFFVSFFPFYASLRGVVVYEEFVEGAKEGFQVAVRIIPFLVAILVAIGMFRGAGGIDKLTAFLAPVLNLIYFPAELLPMVLMRPLSGSGTLGLFTDLVTNFGPDHIISRMGATIFGSTETTFYVIAVYFGSVAVRRTRHAVPAGLIADLVGVIASIIICRLVFL
jgi:spore maturation protein SpmA